MKKKKHIKKNVQRLKPNIPVETIVKMKERLKEQMKRLDALFSEKAKGEPKKEQPVFGK